MKCTSRCRGRISAKSEQNCEERERKCKGEQQSSRMKFFKHEVFFKNEMLSMIGCTGTKVLLGPLSITAGRKHAVLRREKRESRSWRT